MLEHGLAVHQIDRVGGDARIGQIALAQFEIARRVRERDEVDADEAPRAAAKVRQCRRPPAATGIEHGGVGR